MATPRREHLLQVAEQLFYRDGFHATGVDRIQAESGVAKTTLYKHFPSKDALILEVLKRISEQAKSELIAHTDPLKGQGLERIRAVFTDLHLICDTPGFNGCIFNNAAAEFLNLSDDIRELAAQHLAWMERFFADLLAEEQLPDRLAPLLLALYEGILTLGRVRKSDDVIALSQELLPTLLATATPRPTT